MKYDEPQDIWDGITPCAAHEQQVAEDCGACQAELTARSAVIDQIGAEAQARIKGIVQAGGPMMPPTVVLEARLEVLVDSILTDPRMRLQYEGEVGRRVMLGIKDMQAQTKQPTLHVAKNLDGVPDLRRRP